MTADGKDAYQAVKDAGRFRLLDENLYNALFCSLCIINFTESLREPKGYQQQILLVGKYYIYFIIIFVY